MAGYLDPLTFKVIYHKGIPVSSSFEIQRLTLDNQELRDTIQSQKKQLCTQEAITDKYRSECHDLLERHDDLVFTNQALNDEVAQLQRKLNIAIRWSYAVTAAIVAGLLVLLW